MPVNDEQFAQIKRRVMRENDPNKWLPERYAGVAFGSPDHMVTVPRNELYCLERFPGKPVSTKMDPDGLRLSYRGSDGEIHQHFIAAEDRFPIPAGVPGPDTPRESPGNYLLLTLKK